MFQRSIAARLYFTYLTYRALKSSLQKWCTFPFSWIHISLCILYCRINMSIHRGRAMRLQGVNPIYLATVSLTTLSKCLTTQWNVSTLIKSPPKYKLSWADFYPYILYPDSSLEVSLETLWVLIKRIKSKKTQAFLLFHMPNLCRCMYSQL